MSATSDRELLPCPMCGSPAKLDSTGTAEYYGHTWQTQYIVCTKTHNQHCGMELSLMADFYGIGNSAEALTDAWNKLERRPTRAAALSPKGDAP